MQTVFYWMAAFLVSYYVWAFMMERRRIAQNISMQSFFSGMEYFVQIEMADSDTAERLAQNFDSYRGQQFHPELFQQGFSWAQDFAHDNAEWTVSGMRVNMPRTMKEVRKYFERVFDGN